MLEKQQLAALSAADLAQVAGGYFNWDWCKPMPCFPQPDPCYPKPDPCNWTPCCPPPPPPPCKPCW